MSLFFSSFALFTLIVTVVSPQQYGTDTPTLAAVARDRCLKYLRVDGVVRCRECENGMFVSEFLGLCEKCTEGCLSCSSPTNCFIWSDSSTSHMILPRLKRALISCDPGKFASNGVCVNCSSSCKTCNDSKTSCTSCADSLVLHEHNCLAVCPPNFYSCKQHAL